MVKQSHGRQPREARQRRSSASADDIDMSAVLYEQELRDTGMCCAILGSETLTNGWQKTTRAGSKPDRRLRTTKDLHVCLLVRATQDASMRLRRQSLLDAVLGLLQGRITVPLPGVSAQKVR